MYTVISPTRDLNSDHRMQSRNSTTELLVHIAIYNIILLLKKENVHLFPCPWGHDYVDAYLQSSWKDVAGEVTMSSVRVWINLQDTSG